MNAYKENWPIFIVLAVALIAAAINVFGPQPDPSTATSRGSQRMLVDTANPARFYQQEVFDECNAKAFKGCYYE